MAAPTTVDEYMAALPPERRAAMELLRSTIKAAVPEATEVISYKMPAFKSHGGQFLVMELLRSTIKAAVPEATEVISYKMPAFKSHGGQFLVSYDAYKAHYSLFPGERRGHQGMRRRADATPVRERDDPLPGRQAHPRRARDEDPRGPLGRERRSRAPVGRRSEVLARVVEVVGSEDVPIEDAARIVADPEPEVEDAEVLRHHLAEALVPSLLGREAVVHARGRDDRERAAGTQAVGISPGPGGDVHVDVRQVR